MKRLSRITAAALLAGSATAGMAAAQSGPPAPPDALTGPMAFGRGGIDLVAIDTDGNGSLSRAELVSRATERLARADADGDGTLTRVEIVDAMPGRGRGLMNLFAPDPAEAFADRLLAMMGATEAGQVSVADLAGQRVNFLLAFADTDRDAAISQPEADALDRGRGDRRGSPHRGHGPDADGPGRHRGPADNDE